MASFYDINIGNQKINRRIFFTTSLIREVEGFATYENRITKLLKCDSEKLSHCFPDEVEKSAVVSDLISHTGIVSTAATAFMVKPIELCRSFALIVITSRYIS